MTALSATSTRTVVGRRRTQSLVFHIMKLQCIGLDGAAQALIVSKALKSAMKERGISAVEAIDDLTAKLSLANLLAFSGEKFDDQVGEINEIQRPTTPTLMNRLTPVAPLSATTEKQRNLSLCPRKGSVAKKPAKPKVDASKGKVAVTTKVSRKRAISGIEQESNIQSEMKGRARADSVTEVVKAKMAGVETGATEVSKPAAVVRGKRRSTEDSLQTAATHASGKRHRSGEA